MVSNRQIMGLIGLLNAFLMINCSTTIKNSIKTSKNDNKKEVDSLIEVQKMDYEIEMNQFNNDFE